MNEIDEKLLNELWEEFAPEIRKGVLSAFYKGVLVGASVTTSVILAIVLLLGG